MTTNLSAERAPLAQVVRLYGLRNWIEQSYKKMKDELGWADFMARRDRAICRHWALVCCAFAFCWWREASDVRLRQASREELFDAVQGELTASHRFVLDELMRHVEEIEARIARFDARLLDGLAGEYNALALLQTLPGVDLIGAAMLLVEIGSDMDAFGSADRLACWVGICPGNNESAGKRKSGRVRKGNLYVRRLLCEFAHAASRTTSVFKSKFQALIIRRGHKRSIVALAHKLLRTMFFMLKRGEHYRDCATDYEALSVQRNAPRWIKALTRFGFIPATA